MSKCNFNSYEGSKNFIFISYAHKDSEQVYPIIESLNARGYRVWYDDGISPGSEWPEYIARHIDMCDTVIFFASPNSVASENCRREINFTISRNKKFLCIILEPTDFSLGMELQLSSYQSVMKYEYPDDESFFNKLLTTNLFKRYSFAVVRRHGFLKFLVCSYILIYSFVVNSVGNIFFIFITKTAIEKVSS